MPNRHRNLQKYCFSMQKNNFNTEKLYDLLKLIAAAMTAKITMTL